MMNQEKSCPNLNHERSNAPVRSCPWCGDVVNESIPMKGCSEAKHAQRRRDRDKYCIDCGEQLIHGHNY